MVLTGRFVAMSLTVFLSACATPKRPAESAVADTAVPVAAPAQSGEARPAGGKPRAKQFASRRLKPMPVRPLNASVDCGFRDETGYAGKLRLDVEAATVTRFDARVNIPKRGSCRFRLQDFEQTGRLPAVVLAARKSNCTVSLWEQGPQVTVAFRGCRSECSGNSADYLWPILVDNRDGACS